MKKLALSTLMTCLIIGNAAFAADGDLISVQNGSEVTKPAGRYRFVLIRGNSTVNIEAEGENVTFTNQRNTISDDNNKPLGDAMIRIDNQKNQGGKLYINADEVNFETKYSRDWAADNGYQRYCGFFLGNSDVTFDVNKLYIGSEEKNGERAFQLQGANNKLNFYANEIVAYVSDQFVNAQADPSSPALVNIGSAENRVGLFEVHTALQGYDESYIGILHTNEGSTINLYADTAILDGGKWDRGGVIGSGTYGTVNVDAKNLIIDGNICGTYGAGSNTGKELSLNVTADNLNMTGDINIGSLETTGSNFNRDTEVNITVTENANITGDINIYGNDVDNAGDDSVLNIDFQNNAVLTGKINVEGNLGTVNLGGNADMTSSSGVYNVTNGGNVNFTGGTWAVNEWTGNDGNMSVGTGAEVTLNDNVEVATVTLADGSTTIVDADKVSGTVITATTTNVSNTAQININNFDTGSTIKLFSDENANEKVIANEQVTTNNLMQTVTLDENKNLVIGVADASEVLPNVAIGGIVTALTANNVHNDFFDDVLKSGDTAKASEALNSVANMGELAGVNHGTYSMSNAMTDAVAHHLSIATHGEQDKDIWAHYIHNKEDIDGMDFGGVDGSYEAQYNGIVVGSDLYKNGKTTAGIALSYADGNINGSNIASSTKNEAEYYGASLYGRIDNGDSAILGDISYMHSDNDITQNNSGHEITASADADAFSIGIRAEQAYKAGAGKFVPYAGIRYMHLGAGNYDNSLGMSYDVDDQNLWLLPVGVTYSAEVQSGDWTVKPIAEVGYVWTMGDRDTDQTVSLNGASDTFGFETADSGSFIGRLGIEAEKADVTYGLSYEYQKGDTVKANKWMANLTFSF